METNNNQFTKIPRSKTDSTLLISKIKFKQIIF